MKEVPCVTCRNKISLAMQCETSRALFPSATAFSSVPDDGCSTWAHTGDQIMSPRWPMIDMHYKREIDLCYFKPQRWRELFSIATYPTLSWPKGYDSYSSKGQALYLTKHKSNLAVFPSADKPLLRALVLQRDLCPQIFIVRFNYGYERKYVIVTGS